MAKTTFAHARNMVVFDDANTTDTNARALWENATGNPADVVCTIDHNLNAWLPNNASFDGKRPLSVSLMNLDGYLGTCTNNGWQVASTSANRITITIKQLPDGASVKGLVICKAEHSIVR